MAKDDLLKQLKGLSYKVGKKEKEELQARDRALQPPLLKNEEVRATYIIKQETVFKIRELARDTKQNIKDIVQTALDNHLKNYSNEK